MIDLTLLNPIAGIGTGGNPRPVISLPLTGNLGGGGIGEGSFKRASSASYFDKDTILRTVNGDRTQFVALVAQEDISNGYWSVGGGSASNAEDFLADQTTNTHSIFRQLTGVITPDETYTLSAYAKAGETDYLRLTLYDTEAGWSDCSAWFNIRTGTFVGKHTSVLQATINDMGDGWFKISMTRPVDAASTQEYLYIVAVDVENAQTLSFPGLSTLFSVKNIMVEELSSGYETYEPSEYVNSLAIPAVPRFTKDGLLLEGPGTNYCLQSREFDNVVWAAAGGLLVTADQVGIDGIANTAYTLEDNDTENFEWLTQNIDIPDDSNTHVVSCYIKKDNNVARFPALQLNLSGGDVQSERLILNTKTGADEISGSGSVVDSGDWWYCSIPVTNNSSGNIIATILLYPAITTNPPATEASTVGSIIADQMQLELNRAYPSSPIITEATAVTRATEAGEADVSGAQWDLDGTGTVVGPNVIVNGDFADWTADNPDVWGNSGQSGSNPMVTEVSGACRIYSSVDFVNIWQNTFTRGKMYKLTFEITASVAGSLTVLIGTTSTDFTGVGVHTMYAVADTIRFEIKRKAGTACDITFDNVVIREVSNSLTSLLAEVLGEDEVTNGDMEAWAGTFPDDWNGEEPGASSVDKETTIKHGGSNSAKLNVVDGAQVSVFTDVAYIVGNTYKATLWLYGDGVNGVNVRDVGNASGGLVITNLIVPAAWTQYTYYFVANSNSDKIYINRSTSSGTWAAYVDDVSVEEVLNDSRGTMVLDLTPGFKYDQRPEGSNGIVSADNTGNNLLKFGHGTAGITSRDGSSDATNNSNFVPNVTLRMAVRWGTDVDNVRKFSTARFVSGVLYEGAIFDFDGAYAMDNHLLLAETNPYPFTIKNLRFFDRVLTDAEIEKL